MVLQSLAPHLKIGKVRRNIRKAPAPDWPWVHDTAWGERECKWKMFCYTNPVVNIWNKKESEMSKLIGEIKGWIRHQPTPSKLLMSAVTAVESMGATLRTLNVAHMSRVHPVCSYIRVLVMQDMKWVNGCSFCRWMLALDSREKKI